MKINNKFETNLEKLLKEFYIKSKKLIYFFNHFTGREGNFKIQIETFK